MSQLKYWDGTAWVDAVIGAQGGTGTQGLQGVLGPQGLTGSQGIQGTTGVAGGGISGFNAQSGTSYTLAGSDVNKWVTTTSGSAVTVTVPPSVFAANDVINVQQTGAGQVTFAAGSGVTITSTGATSAAPKLRTQQSACSVVCTASDTFTIVGDIS